MADNRSYVNYINLHTQAIPLYPGNRLTKTTSSETDTGTYDNQDRLLTYGKWAYTYTANGELQTKTDTTNGAVTTYSYDGQGNLRHVSLPDGRAIDYVVDAENRRVGKKINGALVRRWLYKDTLRPAAEFDGAGNLLAHYVDGLVIKGANTYKVVTDQLGTPRLLVDRTTGTIAQRLDFDEFGQVTSDSSPGFQTFGFAGGIYDADTGLVRFGARDYDPAIGRWTATDPIRFGGGQSNMFSYVDNDPINRIDPEGTITPGCAKATADMALACSQVRAAATNRDPRPVGDCAAAIITWGVSCLGLPDFNTKPKCISKNNPDYNNPDFYTPRLYSVPTDVPSADSKVECPSCSEPPASDPPDNPDWRTDTRTFPEPK